MADVNVCLTSHSMRLGRTSKVGFAASEPAENFFSSFSSWTGICPPGEKRCIIDQPHNHIFSCVLGKMWRLAQRSIYLITTRTFELTYSRAHRTSCGTVCEINDLNLYELFTWLKIAKTLKKTKCNLKTKNLYDFNPRMRQKVTQPILGLNLPRKCSYLTQTWVETRLIG